MKCGRSLSFIRVSIVLSTQRASALRFRPFGQRAPPKKQPSSLSFDSVVALRGTRCTKSEICIKICVCLFLSKVLTLWFEIFNWHISEIHICQVEVFKYLSCYLAWHEKSREIILGKILVVTFRMFWTWNSAKMKVYVRSLKLCSNVNNFFSWAHSERNSFYPVNA